MAWFIAVAAAVMCISVAADDDCGAAGTCTVPSSCDAAANAVPWAPCSSRNWAEGIPGGRSTAAPTVDAAFTACNAPRAMRRCAAVYDQCPPNGTDAGVTVPGGYDAAFLSAADIDALPSTAANDTTKASLHAYAGLQGAAAVAAVCGAPLTLATQAEAQALYDGLLARRAAVVAAAYDAQRAAGVPAFAQLGRCYRTALVDVFWDRALPGGAPAVWAAAVAGDWLTGTQAVYALARDDVGQYERYQRLGRVLEVCRQSCDVDMIILLDQSGSVTAPNFEIAKDATKAIIDGFSDLTQNGTRVGVAAYNDNYYLKWNLDKYNSKASYNAAISSIVYGSGGTKTGNAITQGAATLLSTARPVSDIVPRAMIVITDGKSSDSVDGPSAAARAAGITMYAIGVAGFDIAQIRAIAGSPDRAFTTKSFSDLVTIAGRVGGSQCLSSAEIPSGSTVTNDPGQSRYLNYPIAPCDRGSRIVLTLVSGTVTVYYSLVHATPNAGNADGSVELNATRREAALELVGRAGAGTAYLGMVSPDGSVVTITAEECPPTATPELTGTPQLTTTHEVTTTAALTKTTRVTASPSLAATASSVPTWTARPTSTASQAPTGTLEITSTQPRTRTTQGLTSTVSIAVSPSNQTTATAHPPPTVSRPGTASTSILATTTLVLDSTATRTATAPLSSSARPTVTKSMVDTASAVATATPGSGSTTRSLSVPGTGSVAVTATMTAPVSATAVPTASAPRSLSNPRSTTGTLRRTRTTTGSKTEQSTVSVSAAVTASWHPPPTGAAAAPFLQTTAGHAVIGSLALLLLAALIVAVFVVGRRLRLVLRHRGVDDDEEDSKWTQRFLHKGDAEVREMSAERAVVNGTDVFTATAISGGVKAPALGHSFQVGADSPVPLQEVPLPQQGRPRAITNFNDSLPEAASAEVVRAAAEASAAIALASSAGRLPRVLSAFDDSMSDVTAAMEADSVDFRAFLADDDVAGAADAANQYLRAMNDTSV